jgi:hypothetical protein
MKKKNLLGQLLGALNFAAPVQSLHPSFSFSPLALSGVLLFSLRSFYGERQVPSVRCKLKLSRHELVLL